MAAEVEDDISGDVMGYTTIRAELNTSSKNEMTTFICNLLYKIRSHLYNLIYWHVSTRIWFRISTGNPNKDGGDGGDEDNDQQSFFEYFEEGLEEDLADIMILESIQYRNQQVEDADDLDHWHKLQDQHESTPGKPDRKSEKFIKFRHTRRQTLSYVHLCV